MTLKRILPFFVIIFMLTGCFREASDTFDTVDSSGGEPITPIVFPSATATEEPAITIIAPGLDTPTDEPTEADAQTDTGNEPTDEPTTLPTSTNVPPPTADTSSVNLPTATPATFITPVTNIVVDIPTETPVASATRALGLLSTPSDEETAVEATPVGECEYVVQSGDNAFRIALNHNVTLDDLLAVNSLPANPILQIGQVLLIPGCDASGETVVEPEATAETTETAVQLEDGFRLHTVVQGESLLVIARQYGVTVNAIIAANADLEDPNRIMPGMELRIPPAEEE